MKGTNVVTCVLFVCVGIAGLLSQVMFSKHVVAIAPRPIVGLQEQPMRDSSIVHDERIQVSTSMTLSQASNEVGLESHASYEELFTICQSECEALRTENLTLNELVKDIEREMLAIRWSTSNPPYVAFLKSRESALLSNDEQKFIQEVLARFPVELQTGEALALRDLAEECFGPGRNCDDRIIQILGATRLIQELSEGAKQFLVRDMSEEYLSLLGLATK